MENKELHWTFESEVNLQTRIASDFLAQIEEKIAEKDWTHAEVANALGVTEGRISQVFNNPGNLTLKTMMKMAAAVDLLVSVVAYSLGEASQESGPVASGIFDACWKKLQKPKTHWDLEKLTVSFKRVGTESESSCHRNWLTRPEANHTPESRKTTWGAKTESNEEELLAA